MAQAAEQNLIPWELCDSFEPDLRYQFDDTVQYGPIHPPSARRTATPINYFDRMCITLDGTQDVIETIIEETNRYAIQVLQEQETEGRVQVRTRRWSEVGRPEMKAFLGLWLAMGVVVKKSMRDYWRDDNSMYATPKFNKVMPRERFFSILKFLHIANNEDFPQHGEHGYDPTNKVNDFVAVLNQIFGEKYKMKIHICVDESMVGHKGKFIFTVNRLNFISEA